MVRSNLLFDSILEVLHSGAHLLQVDVAKATVEQDFARIQSEFQAQLLIINVRVATQVQERIIEVGEGFLEIANQKVRNSLLEIRDSKVLVQSHGTLVAFDLTTSAILFGSFLPSEPAYRFIMFTEGRMDYPTVEKNLRGIRDVIEDF